MTWLSGTIEGFYGKPWTRSERFELFDWMAAWGLNTYFYAPKDDLHHRALWREPYPAESLAELAALVTACAERRLLFIYGLSPGLDIRYADAGEMEKLQDRIGQMLSVGCRHFALLFDDIPDRLDPADLDAHGSLASAQCRVTNTLYGWTRERQPDSRFLFCPTAYCGRMSDAGLGGPSYLGSIGRELLPDIEVAWTGPDIVSREIPIAHAREIGGVLRRKPLIWENLHANDYDGRRFFCGPYAGRPPGLRSEVSGILSNPNSEFPLNFVPLRTLAEFAAGSAREPREAYVAAMEEWRPRFETIRGGVTLEDLVLLGDCFYLPYEEGTEARALLESTARLLAGGSSASAESAGSTRATVVRLRDLSARLAELRDRPLFHALSRRLWDLREELDLMDKYFAAMASAPEAPFSSDFHRPGTFRGGFIAHLQSLLVPMPDGTFTPAPRPDSIPEAGAAPVRRT